MKTASIEPYLAILKQYWGYDDFRPLQSEIIQSIASGHDTLGLMPTGGGKSLTFQVPALAQEGLCLVVTPLIALMRDQVDNLQSRGIKAAMICTGMSRTEILTTLDNCTFGNYKFLYVSPERLSTDIFINRLPHLDINLITVDEAHCISQWGYDFRPSYLKIADIRSYMPGVPLLALTATATKAVIDDIQQKLLFKEPNIFSISFERPNLAYVVRRVDDKLPHIIHILSRVSGSAIVYVRARTKTKEVADFLNKNSVSADYFHAGLPRETKDTKQLAWKGNKVRVMVATNAFGMGIDKSDVRVVIHLDLPDSVEAYFQEAGRAGRDGKKAYAILIYSKTDGAVLKRRIFDAFPPKERIIYTYNCLCNFYQIAIGSGFGFVVPFDLTKFCVTYHLPLNSTYHALKILEQAGYIELTDELDNPSRLMITVTKEDLYLLRQKNDVWDTILQVTLRSYTGLFSDYAHISEEIIAQRAGTTREEVYIAFSQLTKENIVNYIPARKSPFVSFTQSRENERYIAISKEVYEDRLLQFEGRINAMLSYAEEENICRSQQLLSYFGQLYQKVCNQCDVCLKKKNSTFSEDDFEIYKETLGRILKNAPSTVQEILTKTKLQEEKIQQVIRYLQDDGTITVNDALQLCWRK